MNIDYVRSLVTRLHDAIRDEPRIGSGDRIWLDVSLLKTVLELYKADPPVAGLLEPAELKAYEATPTFDEVLAAARRHCCSLTIRFSDDE